jgi:hypothetical protein
MRTPFEPLKTALALVLATTTLVVASPAFADDDDGDGQEETEVKKKSKRKKSDDSEEKSEDKSEEKGESKAEERAEERSAKKEAAEDDGDTDHDKMVHHVAIGFYGISDVPVGLSASGAVTVSAPAIGARYWINQRVGIDGALGMNFPSATAEANNGATSTTTDLTVPHAMLLHVGVPIAVTTTKHATFLVTPELNFGFGGSTTPADPAVMGDTETNDSGNLFQVGARGGAEVHFGFMGIPNLSLEGGIGLYLNRVSVSTEKGDSSGSLAQTSFTTNTFNSPWDFFKGNVAARYYF